MKADILQTHKSIMYHYDLFLDFTFAQRRNDNVSTKHRILCDRAAFYTSNKSASDGSKIQAASDAAYMIADNRLKKLSEENYIINFKEAYDAALRVELYRQFLGQGQDYKALKRKFKKEKPNDEQNLDSVMKFLLEDIEQNINSEFSKFEKIQSSVIEDEKQIIGSMKKQLDELLDEFKGDFEATLVNERLDKPAKKAAIQNRVLDFQIAAGYLIRSYQVKTKSNESWAPFLLNMLLLITAFGTLPAIYSLRTKAVTGHYIFFDKPTIHQTPVEEMASEDKLLGFNEPIVEKASEKESARVVVNV